jgi:hypothetical protein
VADAVIEAQFSAGAFFSKADPATASAHLYWRRGDKRVSLNL